MADRLAHLYSQETLCAQPSAIREICALVARPEIRSLAGGWPDPAVFPREEIAQIAAELLAAKADVLLQYGSTEGLIELRQELAQRCRGEGDARAKPEDIIIIHGSQQGMDLAAHVFLERGDVVLVGLPTYFGGTGAAMSRGAELAGVPVDLDGLNTELLDREAARLTKAGRRVKGVYLVPNFQNPTGATLPLERRRHLLELAEKHDFVIFEDDPYGELRYEGERLPSLKALDQAGRVVHLRSLSKTFSPGMRLGWLVGETGAVRQMAVAKQFTDSCTNTLAQYLLLEFIRRGLLDKRIEANVAHYRRKRDFMLTQLQAHFPAEVTWNRPAGGFFIFVHLPPDWDAGELLRQAVEKNVAFVTGAPFFVDGSGKNTFRLSYSQASQADIEAAVAELGRLIKGRLG